MNWSEAFDRTENYERRRDNEPARQTMSMSWSTSSLVWHSIQARDDVESEVVSEPSIFHLHRCPSSLWIVKFELIEMVALRADTEVETAADLIRILLI